MAELSMLERVRRLQSVTDAALGHLPLDELLDALLDRIREALDADTCAFLLLDEEAGEVVARAARGLEEEVERGTRIPLGRGFAGRVAAECRPIVVPDVEHADVVNPLLAEKGVKSLLGAPLVAHDRVLGVVHVGTLTPRDFDADDVELLSLVAQRAALAIERAHLFESERAARLRLERLQSVTDVALSGLPPDELLDELLVRVREALGTDTAAVLLLDSEAGELVARAAKGLEEEVEQGTRIPFGGGFAGTIAATRRPRIIAHVDKTQVLNPILIEKGIESMLGVPLIAHDELLGVMHVGTLTPRAFGPADVELLELVGQRVALAIERAELFEREHRARRRVERLQSVTDAALAHLTVNELLDELLVRIRDALGADTCAFLLLDEERNELVARAAKGLEEEVERGVRIPVGKGFAGRIAATAQPVYLPDVDHADVVNPLLREKGIKTLLGAPLISRGQVLGVVHVGMLRPHVFTPADMELLQVVAQRAAIALERAFVHEAVVQLDELQRNFVALASHELRTPVAAIHGAAMTLQYRSDVLDEDTKEELQTILLQQTERLALLVEQLLDLSRLEAGRVELRRERVALRERIAALVTSTAPSRVDDVCVAVDDLEVETDAVALDRVLGNLLTNAFRYGEPPIVIGADARDQHLYITVEDSGSGIAPEFVPRLFERFARADGSAHSTGSGLGLAIARSYAVALGGDLVYDPGPNGARFVFVLPRRSL